jgi:hypothetical protein
MFLDIVCTHSLTNDFHISYSLCLLASATASLLVRASASEEEINPPNAPPHA